jgi:SAM-dependent methyltransferase
MKDPKERFSDRVEDYAKGRPDYPAALFETLGQYLPPPGSVADIGSGTGILSRQLLERGYEVWAVEPNSAMRARSETDLSTYDLYHSVAGSAEETQLSEQSVGLITVAQAFHWFDRPRCRLEFKRILRPAGFVAILWNQRPLDGDPFNQAYEETLSSLAPEYTKVGHRNITGEEINAFFAPQRVTFLTFPHAQLVDREGLLRRVFSSSYVPNAGAPGFDEMKAACNVLFDQFQQAGILTVRYETQLYIGQFSRK